MARILSIEVERKIIALRKTGNSHRAIAAILGISRGVISEVIRDPETRKRKRNPPKPVGLKFQTVGKYPCPTCGRLIVLRPCPACAAMDAAEQNGQRCFAMAVARMIDQRRQADRDYHDALAAFPTDDGSRIQQKF